MDIAIALLTSNPKACLTDIDLSLPRTRPHKRPLRLGRFAPAALRRLRQELEQSYRPRSLGAERARLLYRLSQEKAAQEMELRRTEGLRRENEVFSTQAGVLWVVRVQRGVLDMERGPGVQYIERGFYTFLSL